MVHCRDRRATVLFLGAYIRRARWAEASASVFIGAGVIAWARSRSWVAFAGLLVGTFV